MFGISSRPLIDLLRTDGATQVWFADDSSAIGRLDAIREWAAKMEGHGPRFGYHMNLGKCKLLVKPEHLERASELFRGLTDRGLTVEVAGEGHDGGLDLGQRYLGIGVGTPAFRRRFVDSKVAEWRADLSLLSQVAAVFPHESYCLLTRSMIPRWRYVMRTTPVDPVAYDPLESTLTEEFFPKAFGWSPDSDVERARCALPERHGGLSIPIPWDLARAERESLLAGGSELVDAILRQDPGFTQETKAMRQRRDALRRERDKVAVERGRDILEACEGRARTPLEEALDDEGAGLLSYAPLEALGLGMTRQQFRDFIALRMGRELPDPLPELCPSCGDPNSLSHALKCKNGGWINMRHDEVKDAWAQLFKKVCTGVRKEVFMPACTGVRFASHTTTTKADARADVVVRGLFNKMEDAYTDVSVHDTGAESYLGKHPTTVLKDKERKKRRKYEERAKLAGSFAPLVCSVYGTLAPESRKILSLVAHGLDAEDPEAERSNAVRMHRIFLQVAIAKAVSHGLRSRQRAERTPPRKEGTIEEAPEGHGDCTVAAADAAPHPRLE
jgi:hypothetical protein